MKHKTTLMVAASTSLAAVSLMLVLLLGTRYGLAQPPQPAEIVAALADTAPVDAALTGGATGSGNGGDFLVSAAVDDQYWSQVAYNATSDEYLVVWTSGHNPTSLFGQIYSAPGLPHGENFVIAEDVGAADVTWNSDDNQYLVVFDCVVDDDEFDIHGQRVNTDGTLDGTAFVVSDADRFEIEPVVVYNHTAGEYLAVWWVMDGGNYGIYAQRVYTDATLAAQGSFTITAASGELGLPSVAYSDGTDKYLVVWHDSQPPGGIYGQLVNANGFLDGGEISIGDSGFWQYFPDVAYSADAGQYLVVWSDIRGALDTGYDIYGQRVNENGTLDAQGNFAISEAGGDQEKPSVAYNADDDQYLVVWEDQRHENHTGTDIYGQRVGIGGGLAAQGDFAIGVAPGPQSRPAVAYSSGSHQYLVVWEDERNGVSRDIYGQRVWWPGLPLGHDFNISAARVSQDEPAVAYNSRLRQYLVVWADERDGDADIYGQRYDRNGVPLGENLLIYGGDAWDQIHPDVAYNADANNYLVVWEDDNSQAIRGQLVSAQGSTIGSRIDVSDGEEVRYDPAVAYNSNPAYGDYLVVFARSKEAEPTDEDLYGRKVYGDGSVSISDFAIATADGDQGVPDVAFNATDGEFLVTWEDKRTGGKNIYAALVGPDENVLESDIALATRDGNEQAPAVVHNTNADEYLVVWHDPRDSATMGFNIYAQRVYSDGTPAPQGNFAVSGGAGDEKYPDLVYVSAVNRYRVVWQDDREDATLGWGWDIRGHWVAADGSLVGVFDDLIFRYPGYQEYPAIAYSPHHDRALTVWQDGRSGETDVYGRLGALDVTPPVAYFNREPTRGAVSDTFEFNARLSSDNMTPRGALRVRWDWENDGVWDTDLSLDKYVTHTYDTPGLRWVKLGVWDTALLSDTVVRMVIVTDTAAAPPLAHLIVSPTQAAVGKDFSFDARGSSGDPPAGDFAQANGLVMRWDWDNDGEFDTGYGVAQTAVHSYTAAGDYTARVEVLSASGLSRSALRNITVLPGEPISLEVSPAEVTMVPGEAVQFGVVGWDAYGNEMLNPSVVWTVTNSAAGVIDSSGVFTASATAGTYADVIQVESDGVVDTASVTVFWPYKIYLPLVLRDD